MKCLGCFKQNKNIYCNICKKKIFDNKNINAILDFDKKEFLFTKIQFSKNMSISGVQDKISLKIQDNKLIPTIDDGEYLLKPIPLMEYGNHIESIPINEHFTMQLAHQVYRIECALNALIKFSDGEIAYITRRFDKKNEIKIKQEDFASLANMSESSNGENYKYDYSYENMAKLIKKYLVASKIELVKFFKLVLFNYLVGNADAHLKNFSVVQRETKDYTLSPAYDLLSSSLHIPNESRTALELFEEYESKSFSENGFYAYDDFMKFGEMMGLSISLVEKLINDFLKLEKKTLELLEISFFNEKMKEEYKKIYLDRLKAVLYKCSK